METTSENIEEMKLLIVDAKTNHACVSCSAVIARQSQKDPSIIFLMDLQEEEERLESVSFLYLDLLFSAHYDLEEVP